MIRGYQKAEKSSIKNKIYCRYDITGHFYASKTPESSGHFISDIKSIENEKFNGGYFSPNSFSGLSRDRESLDKIHCVGVDIDKALTEDQLNRVIKNIKTKPTLIIETETDGHYHLLFFAKSPIEATEENIKRVKQAEHIFQVYYNKEIYRQTNIKDAVDFGSNGPERWWRIPFDEKMAYVDSEKLINLKDIRERVTMPDKNHKSVNLKSDINTENYAVPFFRSRVFKEGERNDKIFGTAILARKMGFSFEQCWKAAEWYYDNRLRNKRDFSKKELREAVKNGYKKRYQTENGESWGIAEKVLEHLKIKKSIDERKRLHYEESIRAILKYIDDNGGQVHDDNWESFCENASKYLPSDSHTISVRTWYVVRDLIQEVECGFRFHTHTKKDDGVNNRYVYINKSKQYEQYDIDAYCEWVIEEIAELGYDMGLGQVSNQEKSESVKFDDDVPIISTGFPS
jgi:hypothetical protein